MGFQTRLCNLQFGYGSEKNFHNPAGENALDGTDGTSLECNKKICDQLIDFGPRQKSDPHRLAFGSITMNEDQKVWGGVVRMWKETEMISHFLS